MVDVYGDVKDKTKEFLSSFSKPGSAKGSKQFVYGEQLVKLAHRDQVMLSLLFNFRLKIVNINLCAE